MDHRQQQRLKKEKQGADFMLLTFHIEDTRDLENNRATTTTKNKSFDFMCKYAEPSNQKTISREKRLHGNCVCY